MPKLRLDQLLVAHKLVATRSQAESYVRLGKVKVGGKIVTKPGAFVDDSAKIELDDSEKYVSRAGLKLASVAKKFGLNFDKKIVLDVGSSTGGFTDYALQNGAKKVIAVEVGTNQMHPSLLGNPKIEIHEKTDIRNIRKLSPKPDIVVVDVSFISLREILPHVSKLISNKSELVVMVKPQFEAQNSRIKHKGVIKNEAMRREILKDFEQWAKQFFYIVDKQDSEVAGEKGNKERFFVLNKL
jgi:23S rRNA (cytidine1920-2'-O)/16S rRNA (cytidine1409-2'-O)-methyltransferase